MVVDSPEHLTSTDLELPPNFEDSNEDDQETKKNEAVLEDDATLEWILRLDQAVVLPGGTSVDVDARTQGPLPQSKLLIIVEPLEKFDPKRGVDVGIPRGVQYWDPRNPIQCKVTNISHSPCTQPKGIKVATGYSVNNYDLPRIRSLISSQVRETIVSSDQTLNEPLEGEQESQSVNLEEANVGQLTPSQKRRLMALLEEYRYIFAAVEACGGPLMMLEVKDPNSKPYVTPTRNYTPSKGK